MEGDLTMTCVKQKDGAALFAQWQFHLEPDGGSCYVRPTGRGTAGARAQAAAEDARELAVYDHVAANPGCSQSQVERAVPFKASAVREILRRLSESERIVRESKGQSYRDELAQSGASSCVPEDVL